MSLLDDVRIVVTPNGYKARTLFGAIPVPTFGSDEITNGGFATDSDWSKGGGWSIGGGVATHNGSTNANIAQSIPLTVGTAYSVTYTVINASVGSRIGISTNATSIQIERTTDGTYTETFTAATSSFYIRSLWNNGSPVSLDSVSVKEWTGADMDVTRGTAATRVDENGFVNYAEVIGSDLITNGDFTSNIIGWGNALISTVPDIVWNNGKARITNTTGSNYNTGLNTTNNPFNGLTGIVKVTGNIQIISGTASSFKAREHYGTVASFVLDASGDFEVVLSLNGTSDDLAIYTYTDDLVFDIDNIVAKEIQRDNVPRIDYTGGGCPHILAEPQRINLVTYSEDFSQSSWASANISLGISTVLSPDGTTYSYKLTNDAASGNHFVRDNSTVTSGVPYTLSVFIKKRTRDIVSLGDGNSVNILANFDLTNGTSTNVSATSSSIESFNDGWFKCIATITPTTTTLGFMIFSGDVYAGKDESGDFYVWGAQLEEGSYATSYIPTSGSTVTRNQDIFTRDGIGSLINSQEGVLFIEMAVLSADTINRYISLSNGTDDNSISFHFRNNANNQVRVILKSGNVNQFDSTYNPSGSTDFVKVAFKYKVNDFALWVNGTEISTDTSGITFTADTLNRLAFDDGQGGSPLFGKVKQLQVYESALTDEQLLQLTGESGTDFYESYAEMASALTYTIQ